MNLSDTMKTSKKDKKNRRAVAPLKLDSITQVVAEYPNIPVSLLRELDQVFQMDTPRSVGHLLRNLWELALFSTGNGLDADQLDELSSVWQLMTALCDSAPTSRDMLEDALN